ncbi:ABC transporter permease [Pseudogracilibacillus sp. SO30301A]|uniref:ABC transporter permease n=1 Tax=Pseudogracilibacillus sp. SO30301A TaxID=3098291 RepID=UPI00300DD8D4
MYAVLRSEKTKFFSFGWCMLGIIGANLVPVLFLLTSSTPITEGEEGMLSLILQSLYLGQLGVIVASASYFGQEYSQSVLRTTLLTQPYRVKLLFTKFVNITVIIVLTGIVSSLLGLIVLFLQHDLEWTNSFGLRLLESVSLATVSWILLAWITSALSIITKSLITPIAIMLPLILGLSQMLLQVFQLAKYLPTLAVMNIYTVASVGIYLDEWLGLGVQLLWAVVLVGIASWLFAWRGVR